MISKSMLIAHNDNDNYIRSSNTTLLPLAKVQLKTFEGKKLAKC